jgi:hypothetical protein
MNETKPSDQQLNKTVPHYKHAQDGEASTGEKAS